MRSVSRRSSLNMGSPAAGRSRSAERSIRDEGGLYLDFECKEKSFDDDHDDDDNDEAAKLTAQLHDHLSSDSSLIKQMRRRGRAMTDPFDTAESGGVTDGEVGTKQDQDLLDEEMHALPTFSRYPFAETQNKNCWSEPNASIFHVRGKDYLRKKKKVTAGSYLLRARGCDLFLSDSPNECRIANLKGALGGNLRKKPSLLIRFTFPWGVLIQYYEIPAELVPYMRPNPPSTFAGLSVGEYTLAKWMMGDDDYKNERLKLISYVAEGPWIVRNLVTGKPAIIGKRLPVKYTYTAPEGSKKDFLECNLDIGNSSSTARQIVSVCRRYMSSLTVDIGFVIEGKTEEELPEEMMGSIRIHSADPVKAPTIASLVQEN